MAASAKRKNTRGTAVAKILADAADPIRAREDKLLAMTSADMRAAGLSTTAPRFIFVNVSALRFNPDAPLDKVCWLQSSRVGIGQIRQVAPPPFTIPISRLDVSDRPPHPPAKPVNMPAVTETPFSRCLRNLKMGTPEEKHRAYRAIAAANVTACIMLKRKTTDPIDRELLAQLIDRWQHQANLEMVEGRFRKKFATDAAQHERGSRKLTRDHYRRFRMIQRKGPKRGVSDACRRIAGECKDRGQDHRSCDADTIRRSLYRKGGPLFRRKVRH
jgi:hypothetical protein